jgi:hypothetical protein
MKRLDIERRASARGVTRRQFVRGAAVGTGVVLAGTGPLTAVAAKHATCGESVQDILTLAYTIERAATTFYYAGLTSTPVMTNRKLAGSSGNPNAVSRNGSAANVANLQAALDQEQKHAQILAGLGATSPYRHFHFPAAAFEHLGFTSLAGSFLWTLDHLETACIAVYLAAVQRFGQLRRPDLALLCVRTLAIECEHRALYRVIAQDDPADNITLPVADFTCTGAALGYFKPYLTGRGFPSGVAVTKAFVAPTAVELARAIGKYRSA